MPRERVLIRAGAVLIALALLAGCGGSGPNANRSTDDELVLGNIGSYSGGQSSSFVGAQQVIKAWASWVNDHGGLAGHRIRLVVKDDASDPATGLRVAHELVEHDHVVAIVGDESTVDEAWASYVTKQGIPVVGGASVNAPFLTNPNFFPSGTTSLAMLYQTLVLAKSIGPRFGFLYCVGVALCNEGASVLPLLTKPMGLQVPVSAPVSTSAPDYVAVCQRLKQARVDSYEVVAGSATVLRIAAACRAQGVTARFIASDGTITAAWLDEPAVDGALAAEIDFPYTDASVPATREYQQAIARYAPELGSANGPNASYAWVAGKLFEKAVAASGSSHVTPESVKQGLYHLHDETLGGLAPPLNFKPGAPALISCGFTLEIKNGKVLTPNGLRTTCLPADVLIRILTGLGR
ncbi:MAG TPA: ABC transporter substrate-binding protein [Mycobacteriales bacterium]|nr:ABC transporter substrate-binding protein [Mycobacteriales bacterium]